MYREQTVLSIVQLTSIKSDQRTLTIDRKKVVSWRMCTCVCVTKNTLRPSWCSCDFSFHTCTQVRGGGAHNSPQTEQNDALDW